MKKVSIIVPVYNTQEYLEKCLDSLINQTLEDIEIICINDGSTDNSLNILNEFAKKDNRIKIINQDNQIQGAARNRGLEIAKGEYVGFIDSDDWIDLDYFEKLYNSAKKYSSDLALATNIRIGNGKTKKRRNIQKEVVYNTTKEKFKIVNVVKDACPTNKIYRLEYLKKNDIVFPEGMYCEDKLFSAKALFYANKLVTVPNVYYYYFRNLKSTVHIRDEKHTNDKFLARLETKQFLEEKGVIKTKKLNRIIKSIINDINLPFVRLNYLKKIKQLQKAYLKRKIKVIFYVTENQKWCYQSLYNTLAIDEHFEPLVLIGILKGVHKGKDKTRNNLHENYEFFKSRNMNVEYAYVNNKYVDFKKFKPDIIFYEQPWDLPVIFKPKNVSKFALTCYASYGLEMFNYRENYNKEFHRNLWNFFVENDINIERYVFYDKNAYKNCLNTGHPKLDTYFEQNKIKLNEHWKEPNKIKIIYAPHHSFENNGLRLATFKENGQFILNLAKKHSETTWIFKPHPRFKFALLKNKIMTEKEIEQYYKEWETIGKIYTQGNYFDIFKSSDFMITDCCSFLGEYMPTMKPIINPINLRAAEMNNFGKKIAKACYQTKNNDELYCRFQELLSKKDNKLKERKETTEFLIDFNEKSANKIMNLIKSAIRG